MKRMFGHEELDPKPKAALDRPPLTASDLARTALRLLCFRALPMLLPIFILVQVQFSSAHQNALPPGFCC